MNEDTRALARLAAGAVELAGRWGSTVDEAEAVLMVDIAAALVGQQELPPAMVDAAAQALERAAVLELVTGTLGHWGITGDEAKAENLHALVELAAGSSRAGAGAQVAVARSRERCGDIVGMERHLQKALRIEPGHAVAHADLGELESVRGRWRAAARHFDAAGRPRVGLAAVIDSVGHGPVSAGRNEPCPCGTGDRYKRCCLLTDGWPLDARVRMLPNRLVDWVERPAWHPRRLELARRAAGVERVLDDVERVALALHDPVVTNLFLFDDGGLDVVLAGLRPLLRADELAVLETWRGCRHDVYRSGWRYRSECELTSETTGASHHAWGVDDELVERGAGWALGVLVPGLEGEELVAAMTTVAGADLDVVVPLVRSAASAGELAAAMLGPVLDVARLLAPPTDRDPARQERLRWLFGADVELGDVFDDGDVDDLVTTTFMRGGGFTVAGDFIRAAARQLVGNEPPEVGVAVRRMEEEGCDRGTILVQLGAAWAAATLLGGDIDAVRAEHRRRLAELPRAG